MRYNGRGFRIQVWNLLRILLRGSEEGVVDSGVWRDFEEGEAGEGEGWDETCFS